MNRAAACALAPGRIRASCEDEPREREELGGYDAATAIACTRELPTVRYARALRRGPYGMQQFDHELQELEPQPRWPTPDRKFGQDDRRSVRR